MSNQSKPELVFINNILTPYRIDEFNVVAQVARDYGIDFRVIFLAQSAPGRYWSYVPEQCQFEHKVASGWTFSVRGAPMYLNPSILLELLHNPPTWLCLAGAWGYPTNLALSWMLRLFRRTWLVCLSSRSKTDFRLLQFSGTKLGTSVKSFLTSPYHGWVVPGSRAQEYVRNELRKTSHPILTFPNTVDPLMYRDRVQGLRLNRHALRLQLGIERDRKVIVWPIRLIEAKNIIPFLDAIRPINRSKYEILIAGDGHLRVEVENWIRAQAVTNVRLLGHLELNKLLELYAMCDALLLPSMSETYGAVVIEAMWAGLPLFLSDHVGVAPDALQPGVNGWLVDPEDPDDMRDKFRELVEAPIERLREMGNESLKCAEGRFDIRNTAERFLSDLQTHFPANAGHYGSVGRIPRETK